MDISPEFQQGGIKSVELAEEFYGECIEKGYSQFEWIHLKKNNEKIYVDVSLTKICVKNNELIHALWRDITEKKNQQKGE